MLCVSELFNLVHTGLSSSGSYLNEEEVPIPKSLTWDQVISLLDVRSRFPCWDIRLFYQAEQLLSQLAGAHVPAPGVNATDGEEGEEDQELVLQS